jgi:glycosyltransferase involved in cell wall biosynthesis
MPSPVGESGVRVVVALSQPPLPEGGAPGRCAVALLRGLRGHGLEVTAVAPRQVFDTPGSPPDDLGVEVVPIEPIGSFSRFKRLYRPRPELWGGEFGERVREAARDADLLHVEETAAAWTTTELSLPSVVHLHYLALLDRSLGAPWRKQFREVFEFTLAERSATRRHSYLAANSQIVADALRRIAPLAYVAHAPLAVDPRYYERATLDGAPVAGMIGTAAWPPTADALRRLGATIWPLVQAKVPDARLRIAGRGTDQLAADAIPGADVLGEVTSADAFLRSLSVLLYPVGRGSGMKVKVLEAIACGIPVVTTPAGAEGIEAGDGVVVAETDEALVRSAVSILTDEVERKERGAAAHEAFMRRYTPKAATQPLLELYRRMLS